MSKYVVIQLQGSQYQVSEGDELLVDKLTSEKPDPRILLFVSDKTVKIGTPNVTGAKIKMKILGEEKGKKVTVQKFKAKSRYRKKIGFRPRYTRILVEKISV